MQGVKDNMTRRQKREKKKKLEAKKKFRLRAAQLDKSTLLLHGTFVFGLFNSRSRLSDSDSIMRTDS